MKDTRQANVIGTTILAGVIGSAATAAYFLMKDEKTRKKILAKVDDTWAKISKLEAEQAKLSNNPIKKAWDSLAAPESDKKSATKSKK